MLESGLKISNLPTIPINGENCKFKNKIGLENTFFLSYAHSTYGINYNKQNYKIPLNALREDIRGYIGIESLVAPWSEQLKLWHGYWNNVNKNKAYVYKWKTTEKNHEHYTPQKFCNLENSYYIIKDAPFPFETEDLNNRNRGECPSIEQSDGIAYINNSINTPIQAGDPYPDSNKIVTKSYIDERLASKRLIEVHPNFYIRDYDCTYVIRASEFNNDIKNIIIHLPEGYEKRSLHNKIEFTLLIEGILDGNNYISPTENLIGWEIWDGEIKITPTWLHSSDNEPIDIREKYLYSNARYLMFRFETITNNIETIEREIETEGGNIVTDYDVKIDYGINILCENFLYRNEGIQKVNDKRANHLKIISSDNTIIQTTTLENSPDDTIITVDLKNPLRINGDEYISASLANNIYDISFNDDTLQKISYIEKLPASINNLKEAHNKIYWSTELSPDIIWEDNNWLNTIPAKGITFNLFYKPSESCKFKNSKNIIWTMLSGQESPDFISNRIYYITFTIVPPIEGLFEQETCFARINWFANI